MDLVVRPDSPDLAERLEREGVAITEVLQHAVHVLRARPQPAVVEELEQHVNALSEKVAEIASLLKELPPVGETPVVQELPGLEESMPRKELPEVQAFAAPPSPGKAARALQARQQWQPSHSDLLRGRSALIAEYEHPDNLRLPEYVRLAHKSRQQIYKDIAARRLLALGIGPRQQRIPSWQLEPRALRLTQLVLQSEDTPDAWTVYRALTAPLGALGGRSAIQAVATSDPESLADQVRATLGLQVVPAYA